MLCYFIINKLLLAMPYEVSHNNTVMVVLCWVLFHAFMVLFFWSLCLHSKFVARGIDNIAAQPASLPRKHALIMQLCKWSIFDVVPALHWFVIVAADGLWWHSECIVCTRSWVERSLGMQWSDIYSTCTSVHKVCSSFVLCPEVVDFIRTHPHLWRGGDDCIARCKSSLVKCLSRLNI